NDKNKTLQIESLSADELPVSITMPAFMRRMKDMSAASGAGFMGKMPEFLNVVINGNHSLIQKILQTPEEENKVRIAKQAYDLALLSQGMLDGKDLTEFIRRSVGIIS